MAYPDGTLLRAADQPQVWLIQGGQRHWIPSPDVFNTDGFSWAAILVVSDAEIDAIPQGYDVPMYTTWLSPGPNDPVLPGSNLPTVNYGSQSYKRWMSKGGGHSVFARGEFVTQTGAITGGTVTENSVFAAGYHSGTQVYVTDADGVIRWVSPVVKIGVNPQGFSNTPQVIVSSWSFAVPMTVADKVGGFGFAISDDPDNLAQILNKSIGTLLTEIVGAVSAIGGLLGGSKKATSNQAANVHKTTTLSNDQLAGWAAVTQPALAAT